MLYYENKIEILRSLVLQLVLLLIPLYFYTYYGINILLSDLSSKPTLVLIYHIIISGIILEQIRLCNINDNKIKNILNVQFIIIITITITSKIIIVTQSMVSIVYFFYLFIHTYLIINCINCDRDCTNKN